MRVLPVAIVALLAFGVLANGQSSTGVANEEILATEGSEITFYGHMFAFGHDDPMPMNTQYPTGESDYSRGQPVAGCGTPGNPSCDAWTENEVFWYTTAGFVQVKQWEEFAYSKIHNERGQTKDIYMDPTKEMAGTFFMSADVHAWYCALVIDNIPPGCWNWDPGVFLDWTVESWVWHANLGDWSKDPESKPDTSAVRSRSDEATLIAHGQSPIIDMYSFDPTVPGAVCGGACDTVYQFDIPYEWDQDFVDNDAIVPYLNDLIVEFEWYQQTDGVGKYIIGGESWNLNTGEDYPASVVMPIRNPLDVELVFPRFVHDKLVILSVLNTPWGSYDIDLDSITMDVKDAAGNLVEPNPDYFNRFLDVSVAHSGHYDPINLTWIWDYQKDKLPAGDYTIDISAKNFQGTYETATTASFSIKKDGTGGAATAGQSGILTFSDEQFEQYKGGAGIDEDAGTDSSGSGDAGSEPESKGSPVGVVGLVPIALLGAYLRRR